MNDLDFHGVSYANREDYVVAVLVCWATAGGLNTDEEAVEYLRRNSPAEIAAAINKGWDCEGIDAAAVEEFRDAAIAEILET